MFSRRFPPMPALLLTLFANNAHAFWEPPYITPANPVAGDTLSMNIEIGVCDAIVFWPDYPRITRDGNAIQLVNYGQHWDPGDLCTYGTGTAVVPFGSYEPGNYTLTVKLNYLDFFSQPQTIILGDVAFTVASVGQHAVTVPTANPFGFLALLLGLSGAAFLSLRVGRARMLLAMPRCLGSATKSRVS